LLAATSVTYDVFGSETLVKTADGIAGVERRIQIQYADAARRRIIRSDFVVAGDEKLVIIDHYDQLGRTRRHWQLEDASTQSATDETIGVKVQTRYVFSGSNSCELVSNPYRATTAGGVHARNPSLQRRKKHSQRSNVHSPSQSIVSKKQVQSK